jgi:hypothetical protein
MPEPMTLEEAKRRYDAASAELDRICQGPRANFRMRIPAQRDDSDLILSDALMALREMTNALIVERDDKAELVKALKEAALALDDVLSFGLATDRDDIEAYQGTLAQARAALAKVKGEAT